MTFFKLLLLLLPLSLSATIENGDFQIWLAQQVRQSLFGNVLFLGEVHHRFDENVSHFFYWHIQSQAAYRSKNKEIALGYRQTYTHNRGPLWNSRYGPIFDLTFFTTFRKMELNHRFRLQHVTDLLARTTRLIYRERLWMNKPITKGIDIVVEEEIFYEQYTGFNQNRVTLGLIFHPTEAINFRPFYRLRYTKGTVWLYQNVFGVNALFTF